MSVQRLDHVAIPVNDMEPMLEFYRSLGFTVDEQMVPLMYSVCQGDMKINLHMPKLWQSERFDLRGPSALPGCGDLCMVWSGGVETLEALIEESGVEIIEGPVERVGGKSSGSATGMSRYCRDPEGNLLEFIIYPD